MKLTVKLMGSLVYAAGFEEKEFDIPGPVALAQLLERLPIGKDRATVVTRKGLAVRPDDALEDGDRIVVSHVFSGG